MNPCRVSRRSANACLALGGLLIHLAAGSLRAQIVNKPPAPDWLDAAASGPSGTRFFRSAFPAPGGLLKSVFLVAGNVPAEVYVNGVRAGEVRAATNAVSLDLTALFRPGTNVVGLRIASEVPEARVAFLLELTADLGRIQWIPSSTHWMSSLREQNGWSAREFDDRGWQPARSLGRVDATPQLNPFDPSRAVDAYNSWKLARQAGAATDPATFTLPPGFRAELVRSARPEEGSWVSMAFDARGRLTLAREKRGLLRVSFPDGFPRTSPRGVGQGGAGEWPGAIEVINDTLLECRGLLYALGALYANANNSKTLVRLRDTRGDGGFDEVTELLKTEGGVGHGRNHVKLGPDGRLYVAHGNNVLLYPSIDRRSPVAGYAEDQLMPCPWDPGMFDGNVLAPAGHVLRLNPDGSNVELFAMGFRNPLDIAFNAEGEMFTFDADMEWDVGAPWYMPNRVLHVVPGADFGWRRGTGRFPASYPDTLPSVVDVGLASPTAVIFGTGAAFPPRYQEALYVCDWAYGRILAIHLKPRGATYAGSQELFVSGRPLNVTDACIGPDGAFWFITGGRGTQSGLYRVTHADASTQRAAPATIAASQATPLLSLRRSLEQRLPSENGQTRPLPVLSLDEVWRHLGSEDRWVRYAARTALESFPAGLWGRRALEEARVAEGLTAWLALVRTYGGASLKEPGLPRDSVRTELLRRLAGLKLDTLSAEQQLEALRLAALMWTRLGPPSESDRLLALHWLEPLYPRPASRINPELCRLLVYLKSPVVVARTASMVAAATTSEDLVQFPFLLRYAGTGWSLESRRLCFEALNRADQRQGARNYFDAIRNIRREMTGVLSDEEKRELGPLLADKAPAPAPPVLPTSFVREWKLADLEPQLGEVGHGRSAASGKAAVISSQCVLCHRVSNDPTLPAGIVGPDLVGVASRYGRRDLLRHVLEPSWVIDEKFRQTQLTLSDGEDVVGTVDREDDRSVLLRTNPLGQDSIEIPKGRIRQRRLAETSPMPSGLLDHLKAEQILDLLAYLESGGDPNHPAYRR